MESYADELSAVQESKDERIELFQSEMNSDIRGLHVYDTIPHYTEGEAKALEERLVNEETSREAQKLLLAWLEGGQCNKGNSEKFYSFIDLCSNRLKKLQTEEKECLDDAQKVQKSLAKKSCCILFQLEEFEKLFEALDKGNIWGNFNQNQIEKIQEWRRDSFNFKKNIFEWSIEIKEAESSGIKNVNNDFQTEKVADKLLGNSIYGLHTINQKFDLKTRCVCENEILRLKSELEKSKLRKKNSEMYIISLVSVFLFDNPDGVNLDGIFYHLQQCSESNKHIPSIGEIENLMRRYPQEFKESSPVESTMEKKWTCISTSQETLSKFRNEQ